MWIEQISLRNYRQYRSALIDFAPPGQKGFTIIQGANGSGKTNLLNAITWCLYAKEYHLSQKYLGLPVCYTGVAGGTDGRQTGMVEVRIIFREGDGSRLVITRTLKFRIRMDGEIEVVPDPSSTDPSGSKLSVLRQIRKDMHPVGDPEYVVQQLIPETIEEYFLFDGERLDRYFQETSGQQILEAVFNISQLELLELLIEHMSNKRGEFLRGRKDLSPQAESIRREIESFQASAAILRKEIDESKRAKGEAERVERELGERLKSLGPENIGRLQDERERLDPEIASTEKRLSDLETQHRDVLLAASLPVIAHPALSMMKGLIDETEESGQIPPAYRQSFLLKLLREERCICGTQLTTGTTAHQLVESRSKEVSVLSEMSEELIREAGNTRQLGFEVSELIKRLSWLSSQIKDQEATLKTKSERLAEIQVLIGKSDVSAIKQLDEEIERYRDLREKLAIDVASKEERLGREKASLESLTTALERELQKEARFKELNDVLQFCERCLQAAAQIRDEIMVSVRAAIEEKTRSHFLGLIWKKNTYNDVTIGEDYNVSVTHQSGGEALGTLSAGERQLLALSFVAALNSVSGFNVPLVIDTPLARISREPRRSVASKLPKFLEGTQVVLLVTEEEYTDDVRDALRPSTGKEWMISYHELKSGAEAEVISFGNKRA